jgi:hypothetical protein
MITGAAGMRKPGRQRSRYLSGVAVVAVGL